MAEYYPVARGLTPRAGCGLRWLPVGRPTLGRRAPVLSPKDLLLSSAVSGPASPGRRGRTGEPTLGALRSALAVSTRLIILSLNLSFGVKPWGMVERTPVLGARERVPAGAVGVWPRGGTLAGVVAGRGRGEQLRRPGSRALARPAPEAAVPLGPPVCGVEVVGRGKPGRQLDFAAPSRGLAPLLRVHRDRGLGSEAAACRVAGRALNALRVSRPRTQHT